MAAPAVLARCRALVEPALVAAVRELSDELLPANRYHFGWGDPDGASADSTARAGRSRLPVSTSAGAPSGSAQPKW